MDISVDRSELLKAVIIVNKAVNFRSTIPTLSGILLSVSGMHLTLRSTNNEMSVDAKLDCTVRETGSTVILGRVLLDLVKNADEQTIVLRSVNQNLLEVSGTKFKFSLNTMSPDDFPPTPNISSPVVVNVRSSDLIDLVKKVSRATTLDETRIIYTGIFIKLAGNRLEAVATDSYRLAIGMIDVEQVHPEGEKNALIPSKNLNDVVGFLTDGSESSVIIEVSDNLAVFKFGKYVVATRLIEGNFPKYEQVLPQTFDRTFKIGKHELLSTLKRMNVLADNHLGVRITLGPDEQKVAVRSPEIGEAEETMTGEHTGPATEIAVNIRYMTDGVSSLSGDTVVLKMNEGTKPVVLSDPEDERFTYVIMPLRS